MDSKFKIEIEDEPLKSFDDKTLSNLVFAQVSGLEERIDYSSVNMKVEIDIKDDPLYTEEKNSPNDQHFDQISQLDENQEINIKNEFETKDELFDDEMEGTSNDQVFAQISRLNESQNLICNAEEGVKDSEMKSPLRSRPQTSGMHDQNIQENHGSANTKLLKMEQQHQCCIVSSLLRESFQGKSEDERRLILNKGPPTPKLSCVQIGRSTNRTFKTSWYEKYKWLCGSVDKNSLFCWPCLIISVKKNIWSNEGFKDWKNLSRALERHSASKEHILNFLSYKQLFKKFNTIQEALNEHAKLSIEEYNVNVSKNREVFKLLINLTSVFCKQELPFRGHNESKNSCNQGNFKEIFQVIINANEELKAHWEKMGAFNGLSKTIHNDIIDCIASELKENIYKSINDALFFSIQVDETIDTNEKAQYSIICRFVNSNGRVEEHFIGFYEFGEDKSAKGICQRLMKVLEPFDFRKKLVAQTYDGASVMASELNELQSYIRNYAPQAIFTHCLAHKLNLVLQNSCKKISAVKVFFSSLQGIPAYFNKSCKRTSVLDRIVGKRMPTHSEVRCNSNAKIVNAVVTERVKLIEVFKELKISEYSKSNTVRQAEAYEAKLCDFDFIFYLLIFKDVFLKTELLFNTFQKKLIDIEFCINQTSICKRELKNMRNEETFQNYFDAAQKETEHTDSTLQVRKNMKCMNECYYKRIFYEILDNIISQISVRFANINSLKFLQLCNSSQFENCNRNFPESALESLMDVYGDFFDKKLLKSELMAVYAPENKQLFYNNDIDAILKNIVENDFQETLPQAYKLFCLIATIPATTALANRSFSCLNRVKTFLRSTMTQQHLSSLALASIEKELLINLSNKCNWHEKIIEKLSLQKEKRIDLQYKKVMSDIESDSSSSEYVSGTTDDDDYDDDDDDDNLNSDVVPISCYLEDNQKRYESDQCFQKLAERTANHVADAGEIEIHQDGSRKQNCLYCMKLVSEIGKHYLKMHHDKVDIKKILSLPVNSEERRRSLKILRLKGNFYHNICVLKRKEGIVIVPKRLQGKGSPYKPKDYIPCINCLGFYYKKDARRHFAICNVSENQPKATIKKGYQLLYTHIYEFEKDVSDFFSGMNDDDVNAAARQDNLITSFVESMVNQRKNIRDTRQQVRLLSRFLLKLREEHGEANDLKSFIDPTNFDNLVRTAKYMSYTQDKPCNPVTFAIHIGQVLGKCCTMLNIKALKTKDKNLEGKIKEFKTLLRTQWRHEINIPLRADYDEWKE